MQMLTLNQPDDWHLHLRDHDFLGTTVPIAAQQFQRAIIMPNLSPTPITTVALALAYRQRILAARPKHSAFTPLMTLYLSDTLTPDTLHAAKKNPHIYACKWYPKGVTTHAEQGINTLHALRPLLDTLEEIDMPLLIHGEVNDTQVDMFDREKRFIDKMVPTIRKQYPQLRIVLEHITTQEAVQYVREAASPRLGATITAHHLLFNRNALLQSGLKPHHYCLPLLQREQDRLALITAATRGEPFFFLGTDSAPHPVGQKECAQGCAGIFSGPVALSVYAEVFEQANALHQLASFASHHGPQFYGLPVNTRKLTLVKRPWTVPTHLSLGHRRVIPLKAGSTLQWQCMPPPPA